MEEWKNYSIILINRFRSTPLDNGLTLSVGQLQRVVKNLSHNKLNNIILKVYTADITYDQITEYVLELTDWHCLLSTILSSLELSIFTPRAAIIYFGFYIDVMMAVSPEADRAGTLIPIVNFRSQKFQLLGNQDFNK